MKRLEVTEDLPLTPQCMQGITLVHCGKRIFRVPTASISTFAITSEQKSITPVAITSEQKSITPVTGGDGAGKNKELSTSVEIKLPCPSSVRGPIIGRGGSRIVQLQYETRCKISLKQDFALIRGSKENVERAKTLLEKEINIELEKLPPSHFISLPLSDSHVHRKVSTFQSDVISLALPNIDSSIMIKPDSLHLTIGMLKLYRQNDIEDAVKLLKDLDSEIRNLVGTRTIVVKLSGIAVMEDNPDQAYVLYAKVEEPEGQNILTRLSEFLISKFAETHYLKKDDHPLKFHATIMNARHRSDAKTKQYTKNSRWQKFTPFSAVQIFDKFANFEFGTCRIEDVHLSKVGTYDKQGRHQCEVAVKLP